MEATWLGGVDPWVFRRSALVHPQPVAVASSRLMGSQTGAQAIDAAVKAAEVLTRYLAAAVVASWRARDDGAQAVLEPLNGNLAFGRFLSIVQQVARLDGHLFYPCLSVIRGGNKGAGKADEALVALVSLRNEIGHDLSSLTAERVATIFSTKNPIPYYAAALQHLDGALSFPLFVAEVTGFRERRFRVSRTLLMGDSSYPVPEAVECADGIDDPGLPHVSVKGALLPLPPMLGWELVKERQNFELLMLDAVADDVLTYATLHSNKVEVVGAAAGLRDIFAGRTRRRAAQLTLSDGRTFDTAWAEARNRVEEVARIQAGGVRWERFDDGTLNWCAKLLDPAATDPRRTIRDRLLDRRAEFTPSELRQLDILFGKDGVVRETVRRALLDVRDARDGDQRLAARRELVSNVFSSLRDAVDFVVERLSLPDVSTAKFDRTDGGPDYIAIREGLVNQFAHQDYEDNRAPAQISLTPGKTVLFNPGYSLLGDARLQEGGRSLQRNPLIARALKLIGWGESAGTGIRRMYETWERAKRRPPVFESNEAANTFTLELTWDAVVGDISALWKARLGVELTSVQAKVLEFIVDAGEPTQKVIAASNGMSDADAKSILEFLVAQGLVAEKGFRFRASPPVKASARRTRQR